ncbi:MAG TPA: adenine deaminase [Lacibacter sp.]|nr:adenine deaminase [Lacibacter sp.]
MDAQGMITVAGNIINIPEKKLFYGEVVVEAGRIKYIRELSAQPKEGAPYILPGFTDAHVHIESSMLVPSEFARLAVVHGTVSTISDPHEIANVCGLKGVEFMIENGKTVPFKFNFGAPSCVPATSFETAGATLHAEDVAQLLQREEVLYLSEMMNFPGVLHGDEEVMKKIKAAHALGKPVDGHAPGLRGEEAKRYIEQGISTDHECFTIEEALDKLQHGMKIIIREGSAAKNFEALIDLIDTHPHMLMFCSDDKHPDSLWEGHINQLCARAVAKGKNVLDVLRVACINPVLHYQTSTGLLREHDAADFILVEDVKKFKVLQTYINGQLVAENGISLMKTSPATALNNFNCNEKTIADFEYQLNRFGAADEENIEQVYVIEALDGQLITNKLKEPITSFNVSNGIIESNTEKDLLYMVVVNRYHPAPVAKCFVKNFGLREGAIASSVAHDSHNIIAVGADAVSLCHAVNLIIQAQGGVSAVSSMHEKVLPLPVAGLMSTEDGYKVAEAYSAIDAMAKQMGSTLAAPYMTLSFMGLLVIPHLKLSDMGLFDGDTFQLV